METVDQRLISCDAEKSSFCIAFSHFILCGRRAGIMTDIKGSQADIQRVRKLELEREQRQQAQV